jgi:hypothetical protein
MQRTRLEKATLLIEHDPFAKPQHTFPDHALVAYFGAAK